MLNYKISVSKDGKKYSLLLKAENEAVARQRVHEEGYSILTLTEITEKEKVGNIFIFEGFNQNKQLKTGKIVGNDILKVYVKLKKDLEYNITKLYPEKDKDLKDEEKNKILKDLEEEYKLYYSGGKKEEIDVLRAKLNKEKNAKENMKSFHLKKQLEETTKLIDHVLIKIDKVLAGETIIKLNSEKQISLKNIRNIIVRLKKSTNITKLKEIGEKALLKIGELELKELEKTKNTQNSDLLTETNKLLKKLGSKKQFIEKDKDLNYKFKKILDRITEIFKKKNIKENKENKKNNGGIDKNSHYYMKNKLYLLKYEEKQKENTRYIFKNIFKIIKDENLKDMAFLKRSVIKQNIILLKAKLKGRVVSYTFIKKGFNKVFDSFVCFLDTLKSYLFLIVLIYTIIFIIYMNLNYYFDLSYNGISYNYVGLYQFLIFFTLYILLYLSINFLFTSINFVIFIFIVIFGIINF